MFTLGIPAFAAEEETEITQELHEEIEEPTVTEEEILDIVTSDEFEKALEEEGIDADEFEEKLEDGDFVIVEDEEDLKEVLTDEQIEEIRKQEALSVFSVVKENALFGFVGLVMLPFVPVMIIVPLFGWVTSTIALASPLVVITLPIQFIGACVESIVKYVTFDDSPYRTELAWFMV